MTSPHVELLFDPDCPNVDTARANLRAALKRLGREVRWRETDASDPSTHATARGVGSPTVLVDGNEVGGAQGDTQAGCCRVYPDEEGTFRAAPSVGEIAEAVETHPATRR